MNFINNEKALDNEKTFDPFVLNNNNNQEIQDYLSEIQVNNLTDGNPRYTPSTDIFKETINLPPSASVAAPPPQTHTVNRKKKDLIELKQQLYKLNERKKLYEDGIEEPINKLNKLKNMKNSRVDAPPRIGVYDTEEMLLARVKYYNTQLANITVRIKNKEEEIAIFPNKKPRVRSYTPEQIWLHREQKKKSRALQSSATKEKNRLKAAAYRTKKKIAATSEGLKKGATGGKSSRKKIKLKKTKKTKKHNKK